MKKLLICIILFLLWTTTGYAYTMTDYVEYSSYGNAHYGLYNYYYINDRWVNFDGHANPGHLFETWTVSSDNGRNGQVWIDVLIESNLTWNIKNNDGLENLFFTGGYQLDYWFGNFELYNQSSLVGTSEFRESGTLSISNKLRILIDLEVENYSSVSMYLDTPIISADPWVFSSGEPEQRLFWSGIVLSLDSRITYFLPREDPLPVPEPATFLLLGAGLVGFAGRLLLNKPMVTKNE